MKEPAAYPRALSEAEVAIFSWCAEKLALADSAALQEQLAVCRVVDEDEGGLWFEVSPRTAPIQCQGFDLVYDDADGGPVEFIIAFVEGYLNWVDRYRADGGVLRDRIGAPDRIRSWNVVSRHT